MAQSAKLICRSSKLEALVSKVKIMVNTNSCALYFFFPDSTTITISDVISIRCKARKKHDHRRINTVFLQSTQLRPKKKA